MTFAAVASNGITTQLRTPRNTFTTLINVCVIGYINVEIKNLYTLLPEQNISLNNLKPDWQEQLKNGTVLIQICSQPPLSVSHSLISGI